MICIDILDFNGVGIMDNAVEDCIGNVASEIFLCQSAGANCEKKMVEAFLWR